MCEQCVPGSLSSSPAQEPGNEAITLRDIHVCDGNWCLSHNILFAHTIPLEAVNCTGLPMFNPLDAGNIYMHGCAYLSLREAHIYAHNTNKYLVHKVTKPNKTAA